MKMLWFTLIVETVFFLTSASMTARPSTGMQILEGLAILILMVCWPILIIQAVLPRNRAHWKKYAATLTVAPVMFVLAISIGGAMRDHLFHRDLPLMEKFVAQVQNGAIRVTGNRVIVPEEYKSLTEFISVDREADNSLSVRFLVGDGFPLKHFGYLYRSNGIPTGKQRQDWGILPREKKWFEISD